MRVVIWGTGDNGETFFEKIYPIIKNDVEIVGFADERYRGYFHGFPILTPKESERLAPDYIIFTESSVGNTHKNAHQIVSEKYADKVLTTGELFSILIEKGFFEDKKVLFYGCKQSYDVESPGADSVFESTEFISDEEPEKLIDSDKYDFVFICPIRWVTEEETKRYNQKIRKCLIKTGIPYEKIFDEKVWADFYVRSVIRLKTNGEKNPDKKFLIFHPRGLGGLAVVMQDVLWVMDYADKHGFIPVVDMMNYQNIYLPSDGIGRVNPWEWYFQQISDYNLSEVYESKNVYLFSNYMDYTDFADFNRLILSDKAREEVDKEYVRLFPKNTDRVLGVIYRGTDYYTAAGHPNPLEPEEFAEKINRIMENNQFEYVFLATEVYEVTEIFKKRFGEKCFFTDQRRFSSSERNFLGTLHFDRADDEYKKGMEYLTVLMLLRKCKGIAGAACTAHAIATVQHDGLECNTILSLQARNKDNHLSKNIRFIKKLLRRIMRILQIGAYSK